MEDPWGSPWTNDSPPKIDLPAPPPHAHFTADHGSQRVSPARTPWDDDDDAWGGWAGAEPGKESNSPRWGRSPGLRPLSGSAAGSRLPSPSPTPTADAWGGQLATLETARVRGEDRNGDSAISLGESLRPVDAVRPMTRTPSVGDLKQNAADVWLQPDPEPSVGSASPMPSEDEGRPGSPDGRPKPALQPGARPSALLRQPSNKVQELVEMYDDMAKRKESVSPVDPVMRKVSGAELPVQDGTPEPEVERAVPELELELEPETKILTETTTKPVEEEEEEEEEESDEEEEKVEVQQDDQQDEDSWSDFESPTQETLEEPAQEESLEEPESKPAEEHPQVIETTNHEPSKEPSPPPPKRPSIPYAIDMSKLDTLFPSVDATFPSPEPVPDVIIDDTFVSISERKAWYRMSRFGSMRRHNLGDDENYVRIGWANSQVREQGIRIVRRWMEEDSIGGRVVLGRRAGAAGAKIFNWDSSAPPVEISELLGRKSHSRQASLSSKKAAASPTGPAFGWSSSPVSSPTVAIPPPVTNHSPATNQSPVTEPSSVAASSPVETVKKSPVAAKRAAPESPAKSPTTARPQSPVKPVPLLPTNRPVSISQPIASPTSPTLARPQSPVKPTPLMPTARPVSISQGITPTSPLAQPPETAGWGDDDDDDDWGDMVSSPTGEANGTFPSMDAIVDDNMDEDEEAAKPLAPSPPEDDLFKKAPQGAVSNGRLSTSTDGGDDKGEINKPLTSSLLPTESFLNTPPQEAASNGSPSVTTSSDNNTNNNGHITKPSTASLSPMDNFFKSTPAHETASKGRPSLDAPSSHGFMPGHSRATTVDWGVPPSQSLMPSHSRSTTVDWSGVLRSPLEASASADLMQNKAKSPVENTNRANAWDSWNLDFLDGGSKPASQGESKPSEAVKSQPLAQKPLPVTSPTTAGDIDRSKDDETVANILRDLPDLSYMLR
ncbi:hypothetical protein ACJ41O_013334 [Fusarium nematophilum]